MGRGILAAAACRPVTHGPAVSAAKRGWVGIETYDIAYEPPLRLRAVLPEAAEESPRPETAG